MTVKMMMTDELGVVEADLLGQEVERVEQGLLRQHVGQQEEQPTIQEPAPDPADAEREGVEQRDEHREHGHDAGDEDRVPAASRGKSTRSQKSSMPSK